MNEIKCIIFDVGGVLTADRVEPVFEEANRILGKKAFVGRKGLHARALAGKISHKEYFQILSRKTSIPPSKLKDAFLQSYLKIMKPNKETLAISRRLRKNGYMVSILSNITEMTKRANQKRKLYEGFYPAIHSCDVGAFKPHQKIFKIFLKKARMKPNECVFIDDRKENCFHPEKLGFNVIHFKNARQLATDLKKLGVMI